MKICRWLHALFGRDEANYTAQIQALKADKPMALPDVKPLRGVVAKKRSKQSHVTKFKRVEHG